MTIVDEKRFPTLDEDLCGFNDGLACLLPDIDCFTRQKIADDIYEGVDADELLLIGQAAHLRFYNDSAHVATERLNEINEEKAHVAEEASSAAAASTQPMDMEELVRQVEELEVQLNAKNKGMLVKLIET